MRGSGRLRSRGGRAMAFTMVDFARCFLDGVKVFCGCLGFIAAAVAVLCVLAVLGGVVGLFIHTGRGGEE